MSEQNHLIPPQKKSFISINEKEFTSGFKELEFQIDNIEIFDNLDAKLLY
tara:strand:+ start:1363 stop:1512 length:150 start_codon:yes stop_codon:yes gene_type:complete